MTKKNSIYQVLLKALFFEYYRTQAFFNVTLITVKFIRKLLKLYLKTQKLFDNFV